MDVLVDRKPTSHLKEKVLRFKPIAFLKRYVFVLTFVFFMIFSFLFGFWDIKRYEIINISGEGIPESVQSSLVSYIQKNIFGKNYFILSVSDVEKDIVSKEPYLEDVSVTKILPNKIELLVRIYEPELISILKNNRCFLLSEDGYVLEHLCEDMGVECCQQYLTESKLYTLTAPLFDISQLENGKERFLYMENISKVIKTVKSLQYGISKIVVSEEILDVTINDERLLRFSFNQDLEIQLSRLIAVLGKIKSDDITFKSLDLRFERPVMRK